MGNDAITAVNHWRGQCLDNFARAEKAIISAFAFEVFASLEAPPKLHETAAHRTRNLAQALRRSWPNNPSANKAVAQLENWSLREKQRNHLVHGCFTVKPNGTGRWRLVNETTEVRKGFSVTNRVPITNIEAEALLAAIISERKELEATLIELKSLSP
ncbi:hypothetical protein [Erythrobacter sp. JK5]|uniref:hypothetical protein n=1 Tax=Erythrobacter sp. JK5 TaxID=2829500 RepID=UPI001BABB562|nr:hypothetical protein [Erythrobacter sp. JK5]QUL37242.1 hypothetical protein KDC96_12790 [Erythrobacter sp. JK5]